MNNKLPNINFKVRTNNEFETGESCYIGEDNPWKTVSSSELFAYKRVVIFSLPGAFTPICTSQQLPAYDQKFEEFKSYGIDLIYCISVNDSFVMNAWSHYLDVKNIHMIPDGTGQFTRLMGMLINKDHLGFGMRSWRYSLIANNMEIEQMFIEEGINDSGSDHDPYKETNPDNLLEFLK
tara:strand:- start:253 stop:789 length:537 start_codon:yes stop_codon:yes gene_type:complete